MSVKYDLIFVHMFQRRHIYYLNIARALSGRCRIAFIDAGLAKAPREKTDALFIAKLKGLGVEEIVVGEKVDCKLLVLPNYQYPEGFLDKLKGAVIYEKVISVSGSLMENDWFEALCAFDVRTIFHYYPERYFFDLKVNGLEKWQDRFTVLSIGDVYGKYRAIDIPEADYIIAYPSHVGLSIYTNRVFLRNVLKLLRQVKGAKVYLKTHNVRDIGNDYYFKDLVTRLQALPDIVLRAIVGALSSFIFILDKLRIPRTRKFYDRFVYYEMHALNARITKRSIPLDRVTEFANFGIEMFLPFIRKGLITGKSMSMFFALLERVPVYMCDGDSQVGSEKVFADIRFWGVPPCNGELTFDPKCFDKISEEARRSDIIQYITKEIAREEPQDRRACCGQKE